MGWLNILSYFIWTPLFWHGEITLFVTPCLKFSFLSETYMAYDTLNIRVSLMSGWFFKMSSNKLHRFHFSTNPFNSMPPNETTLPPPTKTRKTPSLSNPAFCPRKQTQTTFAGPEIQFQIFDFQVLKIVENRSVDGRWRRETDGRWCGHLFQVLVWSQDGMGGISAETWKISWKWKNECQKSISPDHVENLVICLLLAFLLIYTKGIAWY